MAADREQPSSSTEISTYRQTLSDLATEKVYEILKLSGDVASLTNHIHHQAQIIALKDAQIAQLASEQTRSSARLGHHLHALRSRLCPDGSKRFTALSRVLRIARAIQTNGLLESIKISRQAAANQTERAKARPAINSTPSNRTPYEEWISNCEPNAAQLAAQKQKSESFVLQEPRFSIVLPVFKVPTEILQATLDSVCNQTWQNWELCIVFADVAPDAGSVAADNWTLLGHYSKNDARFKVHKLAQNEGIAANSNAALAVAKGQFIALLDHDDTLAPWALFDMATRIDAVPDCDFLFSDKDFINAQGTERHSPLFKPGWQPELLFTANYLTHFTVIRKSLIHAIGGWDTNTDGAQDWDLFFKVIEKSRRIEHVQSIHYHWRLIPGSTASGVTAKPYAALGQLKAVQNHVSRVGHPAQVMPSFDGGYKLVWQLPTQYCLQVVVWGASSADEVHQNLQLIEQNAIQLVAGITFFCTANVNIKALPQKTPSGAVIDYLVTETSSVSAMLDAIASKPRTAALLVLDSRALYIAPFSFKDLTGWCTLHPNIGFASAVILDREQKTVEAGRLVTGDSRSFALFRGNEFGKMTLLGGNHWYRNTSSVGAYCVAISTKHWRQGLLSATDLTTLLNEQFQQMEQRGLRGLVSPHARCHINCLAAEEPSEWHDSMRLAPYFHSALSGGTNQLEFYQKASIR